MVNIMQILTDHPRLAKYFAVNWALSIALVEWALLKYQPLRIKTEKDREMAEKFPAFRRNDLHKVNRLILYLLAPLVFARFFIGWGSVALLWVWVKLVAMGHNPMTPMPPWRRKLIRIATTACARVVLLMMSGLRVNEPKLEVDYSEYLGPDWQPSYENPGTVISNHQCFMDIIVHMYR